MISEIRGATQIFIKNFGLLSALKLTIWLPGSILLVYLRLYVFPEMMGGDEARIYLQELRIANIIELAFGPFYIGAILHAASQFQQGQPLSYGASMSHGARKSFKLLLTRILVSVITILGLIVFIIPGILLALRLSFTDAIVVLEGATGLQACNLSQELTKGKKWDIFLTIILIFVGLILGMILFISFPLGLLNQDQNLIVQVLSECIYQILFIVPVLVLFMFYWNAKHAAAEAPAAETDWQA